MKTAHILIAFALSCTFLACESKNIETSPNTIKIKDINLDERLSHKAKVDKRIDQIEKAVNKIKKIVTMFRRIQRPDKVFDVYTPLDFVIDLNSELKDKIPVSSGGRLSRRGTITLPIKGLSEECRKIETLLESSVIYEEDLKLDPKKTPIGERVTYSFKSCAVDGEPLIALEAEWIGSNLEIKLNNENLKSIFNEIALAELSQNATCKLKQGKKNIIEKISCIDFNVQISTSEKAIVHNMTFSNSGFVRFEANASIYENEIKKAKTSLLVSEDGEVKFDIKKIK